MIRVLLAIMILVRLARLSSFSALTLPPSNTAPSDSNLTVSRNPISCSRGDDPRLHSDFSTCIPSLFSLYATPVIHNVIIWDPGDFKLWGPETDFGGCYILVNGGNKRDMFAVDTLLGPAIEAVNKCFVGAVDEKNAMAKTRVGPGKVWWLSVALEARTVEGNGSLS